MKKYCPNCNMIFPDEAKFCEECGGPLNEVDDKFTIEPSTSTPEQVDVPETLDQASLTIEAPIVEQPAEVIEMPVEEPEFVQEPQPVSPTEALPTPSNHMILCRDGKYRWIYDFGLFKNPLNLFSMLKVYLISVVAVIIAFIVYNFIKGEIKIYSFNDIKFLLIALVVLAVVVVILYYVSAGKKGLKYCILFEMDDNGVKHVDLPKQFKHGEVEEWIYNVTSELKLNPTLLEREMTAAIKKGTGTQFSKVKNVKASKFFRSIKLTTLVKKNIIYVRKEDYDFVYGYIMNHISQKVINKMNPR